MQNINSNCTEYPQFGKLRSFFWPIYSHELKKLLPMFSIFFLISLVYNMLRCMKIPIVITADGAGAEMVPFLKIGGVLPGALVLTYIFTKLNNKLNREQVFYIITGGFLSYFALFMLVLYPLRDHLELTNFAAFLQENIFASEGLKGLIAIIKHWNLALFYVLCEIWGTIVLSMLFWGFANEVTKVNEAKRFYAIFALGSNSSGIATKFLSKTLNYISSILPVSFYEKDSQWIFYQLFFVLFIGFLIVMIFNWMNKNVFTENKDSSLIIKKKAKLSLGECFSYLKNSKYLLCIVVLVVGYNMVYNLADVMWTYKAKQVYSNSKDFNEYITLITFITGVIAVISAFLISGNVVRYFGWTVAALITPLILGVTSIGFFGGLILEKSVISDVFFTFIGNPANLILLIGSIQICLGRGCKYTVFDETKELAFIPLSEENKRKGKAVVDGIASRFGKSGGSLFYIMLLTIFGDITLIVPYIATFIILGIALWIVAVLSLGKMVKNTIDLEAADKGEIFEESAKQVNGSEKIKDSERSKFINGTQEPITT